MDIIDLYMYVDPCDDGEYKFVFGARTWGGNQSARCFMSFPRLRADAILPTLARTAVAGEAIISPDPTQISPVVYHFFTEEMRKCLVEFYYFIFFVLLIFQRRIKCVYTDPARVHKIYYTFVNNESVHEACAKRLHLEFRYLYYFLNLGGCENRRLLKLLDVYVHLQQFDDAKITAKTLRIL